MIDPQDETQALVLSGGAAFAAYEVGVIKGLAQGIACFGGRPVEPKILSGTSAGAFNAAVLASAGAESTASAAARLEQIWREEIAEQPSGCGNGVFRWRADPLQLLRPQCWAGSPLRFAGGFFEDTLAFAQDFMTRSSLLFDRAGSLESRFFQLFDLSALIDSTPFGELVQRTIPLDQLRRSPRELRIAATDWQTGKLRLFDNQEMTDEQAPQIITASAAIPGFFPPVYIGADPYVDGGVVMNTPLSPAIRAGATMLHVVYLDPDVGSIPIERLRTTLGTLQRTFAILLAASFDRDIHLAADINRGLALLAALQSSRELGGHPTAGETLRALGEVHRMAEQGRSFRQLTIHIYHPQEELGGALGYLDFRESSIHSLIERGFRDALEHDCRASGCVMPGGLRPA
jgi:NTE family protein